MINSLTWGLFHSKGNWIKDFWIMLKRIPFVLKHGYYPQAIFEAYDYQIDMWRDILTWFRNERTGSPVVLPEEKLVGDWEDENDAMVNAKFDAMLAALDTMAEDPLDCPNGHAAGYAIRNAAKDNFFQLYSELFFYLWD